MDATSWPSAPLSSAEPPDPEAIPASTAGRTDANGWPSDGIAIGETDDGTIHAEKPQEADGSGAAVEEFRRVVPAHIEELLGPPLILVTESAVRYRNFLVQFALDFEPATAFEWLQVHDLVNLHWEARRYRRARIALIRMEFPGAVGEIVRKYASLLGLGNQQNSGDLSTYNATRYLAGSPGVEGLIEAALKKYGYTVEDAESMALIGKLPEVLLLERLIDRVEERIAKAFRDFYALRFLSKQELTRRCDAILNAESD